MGPEYENTFWTFCLKYAEVDINWTRSAIQAIMAKSLDRLEALFDYSQPQNGELYLRKGDQLELIQMMEDGWLKAMDLSM